MQPNSYPSLISLNLTPDFLREHDLDPNIQPADVPEHAFNAFRRKAEWRDEHAMERASYADPTFRSFLAVNQHTPVDPPFRRAKPKRERPRTFTVPSEDLVFQLECSDGPISFGRRTLMLIHTAHRIGGIDLQNCTTGQVRALVERGAA